MSTHYERIGARGAEVAFLPDGYDVETGEPADHKTTTFRRVRRGAILLAEVDVVVLDGTPDELRLLAQRILSALPSSAFPRG
jgi:hypothetical protein